MSLLGPLKSAIYAHGNENYEIANEDTGSDPQYYGYLNLEGGWIIQKRTASTGIYLYAQGASDYATAWTNRAILASYDTYDKLFVTNP